MIPENTPADALSQDDAQQVVSAVLVYIDKTGVSRTAIARSLGIGAPTLGSVLNWKYRGAWQQIILDLDKWLEEQERRDAAPKTTTFVHTRVAQEIRTVADMASTLNTIGLVYGPTTSGIGKTMALQAIHESKAGSVFVTCEKIASTPNGLIRAIARAAKITDAGTPAQVFQRVKQTFVNTSRLLIVDQIHSLCQSRDDLPFYLLSDLYDGTNHAPQLWCGTSDIVAYFDRGQARGKESLAQIRRRIGICRDLMQRTQDSGGGDGEPLFSIEEIKAVFGRNKMRLSPDAARYLMELANLPDGGALGTCNNLVVMATKINADDATVLTATMLRAAHKLLVNYRAFSMLEDRMAALQPRTMAKVG